jgi:hypothetical protein
LKQNDLLQKFESRELFLVLPWTQREEEIGLNISKSLTSRNYRVLLVVTLVILSVQGWLGDTVNIFYAPSSGIAKPPFTLSGFLREMESIPASYLLLWHAFQGIFLIALAAVVFGLSFRWSNVRGTKVTSGLAFASIISAAIGGFLFVMSGYSDGGNSAQMGGSFIAAYALYFVTLYFAK